MVVKDLAEKTDAKKMDDARVATAREDLAKALSLLEKGIGEREEKDKAVRTRSQVLQLISTILFVGGLVLTTVGST